MDFVSYSQSYETTYPIQKTNDKIASVAFEKLQNQLWYLGQELVVLSLLSQLIKYFVRLKGDSFQIFERNLDHFI
jgi:hypothetical protein